MLTETKVSGQVETLHGIMAEFEDPESLLHAANLARLEGYREMDAYAPMPVEGLAEAIGFRSNWVQRLVFGGGLCGAIGGFMLSLMVFGGTITPDIVASIGLIIAGIVVTLRR